MTIASNSTIAQVNAAIADGSSTLEECLAMLRIRATHEGSAAKRADRWVKKHTVEAPVVAPVEGLALLTQLIALVEQLSQGTPISAPAPVAAPRVEAKTPVLPKVVTKLTATDLKILALVKETADKAADLAEDGERIKFRIRATNVVGNAGSLTAARLAAKNVLAEAKARS